MIPPKILVVAGAFWLSLAVECMSEPPAQAAGKVPTIDLGLELAKRRAAQIAVPGAEGKIRLVGQVTAPHECIPSFCVSGHRIYLINDQGVLKIVDLVDPQKPAYLGFCRIGGHLVDVAFSDDRAYVTRWGLPDPSGARNCLVVVDVSDPASPSIVGSYTFPFPTSGGPILVSDNLAYLAGKQGGVRIADVSDPGRIIEKGVYDIPGNAVYLDTSGPKPLARTIFYTPGTPLPPGVSLAKNEARDVFLVETLAYVLWMEPMGNKNGLHIVDTSNPAKPVMRGFLASQPPNHEFQGLFVSGNHLYLGENGRQRYWLRIFDVSDPTSPSLCGVCELGWGVEDIFVDNNLAFVGSCMGLRIVDVRDPTNPVPLVDVAFPGGLEYALGHPGQKPRVYAEGGRVYITAGPQGLLIFEHEYGDPESASGRQIHSAGEPPP